MINSLSKAFIHLRSKLRITIPQRGRSNFLTLKVIRSNTQSMRIEMLPDAEFSYSVISNKPKFQLIASAYACSPSIPVSDDAILDLKIFSDTDFNSEYPAGKNLTGIFDVYALYRGKGFQRYSLSDFIADNPSVPDQLILLLNESPAEAAEFQFTIHYSQDGDKLTDYEFTTRTLTISP